MENQRAMLPQVLAAIPLHGEVKLRSEGLRTRDAHVMEWAPQLRPALTLEVLSRAEPWPRLSLTRRFRSVTELPREWDLRSPQPIALPGLRDRQQWWVKSAAHAPRSTDCAAAIVWNPLAPVASVPDNTPVLFDLLDDWTVHQAFAGIRDEVERGYRAWFDRATVVTANSEGTVALARRLGRDDARLILNGCDPERFTRDVNPHAGFVVGYGGKLGHRLDVAIVEECATRFPQVTFAFAGPVLDSETGKALQQFENVKLLGDFPYSEYPKQMAEWDVAWAPHALGAREVGGDLIKLYEYRAAGLTVAATKVIGWDRFPSRISALEPSEFPAWIEEQLARPPGRDRYDTPIEHTWKAKTEQMLELLSL